MTSFHQVFLVQLPGQMSKDWRVGTNSAETMLNDSLTGVAGNINICLFVKANVQYSHHEMPCQLVGGGNMPVFWLFDCNCGSSMCPEGSDLHEILFILILQII